MASKAKRDQIVALKTAEICNSDITKPSDECRKTVFDVWERYAETVEPPASLFLVESVSFVANQLCKLL